MGHAMFLASFCMCVTAVLTGAVCLLTVFTERTPQTRRVGMILISLLCGVAGAFTSIHFVIDEPNQAAGYVVSSALFLMYLASVGWCVLTIPFQRDKRSAWIGVWAPVAVVAGTWVYFISGLGS